MTVGDIWHFLRRWAMVIWMIVFVITVIFFVTAERADDRAEDRHFKEQDIAVCEGGNRLAGSMRAQWQTLAGVALESVTDPREIERIQEILQRQLELVPTFNCDSLPRP